MSGHTLFELLIVLAVLGVVAGVTGLGFRRPADSSPVDAGRSRIADARRDALRFGRSVTVIVMHSGHAMVVTAHPDGRVVADTLLGIDPLSGKGAP